MRLYLATWRPYGRHLRMSQGPVQFFRWQSFEQIAISVAINVSTIMKHAGGRSHECSIATFCLSAMLLTELAQFIRDEAPSDADPRHTLDFDIKIDQATTPPEYTCGSSEVLSLGGRQVGHGQTHGGTTHILRHGII